MIKRRCDACLSYVKGVCLPYKSFVLHFDCKLPRPSEQLVQMNLTCHDASISILVPMCFTTGSEWLIIHQGYKWFKSSLKRESLTCTDNMHLLHGLGSTRGSIINVNGVRILQSFAITSCSCRIDKWLLYFMQSALGGDATPWYLLRGALVNKQ